MMRSSQGGPSVGLDRQKVVMCPRRRKDPASGHPRAQKPPLGRSPSPPVWSPSQRRGTLPSSVWTRHRAVKQGKSGGSVGTTDQGKGKGSREREIGQDGRGRTQGGERLMDTTAYGGNGSKGRAVNGGRPIGTASCRREQHPTSPPYTTICKHTCSTCHQSPTPRNRRPGYPRASYTITRDGRTTAPNSSRQWRTSNAVTSTPPS